MFSECTAKAPIMEEVFYLIVCCPLAVTTGIASAPPTGCGVIA